MPERPVITDDTVVTIHYTLKDPDGQVLDSSEGGEPLAYLHGAHNIVPGLERQLTGKAIGDALRVVVPPAEGHGERIWPGPHAIERSSFPEEAELAAGMHFLAPGPDGSSVPLWITSVSEDQVLVDINHPLAGVTLHYQLEVVDLRTASAEEIAHQHAHGPGGYNHD